MRRPPFAALTFALALACLSVSAQPGGGGPVGQPAATTTANVKAAPAAPKSDATLAPPQGEAPQEAAASEGDAPPPAEGESAEGDATSSEHYTPDEMNPMTPSEVAAADQKAAKKSGKAGASAAPAPAAKKKGSRKSPAKSRKGAKKAAAAQVPAKAAAASAAAPAKPKISAVPLTPVAPFNP